MSHRDSPKLQGILKNDDQPPVSPSSLLGVRPPMSPRENSKTVSISNKAEHISPMMLGEEKDVDEYSLDRIPSGPRHHRIKGPSSKRLSGRRKQNLSITSLASLGETPDGGEDTEEHHMSKVFAWLRREKEKRAARRARKAANGSSQQSQPQDSSEPAGEAAGRSSSEFPDLEELEQILQQSLQIGKPRRGSVLQNQPRKRPSVKNLHRASSNFGASSDTEYHDGDAMVPSADAWLDNTKTLAGVSTLDLTQTLTNNRQAWNTFKYEIVRLTHTLRLKGWRRVPMDSSHEITVQRLSGALTNAVYVVSPPEQIPQRTDAQGNPVTQSAPSKLLLRIYGPQVDHLIDRESELQILRRLGRKKIGPRMLGTFNNGRFEEYFNAKALSPNDLRDSTTSKQIAKRMRELHDGIELLERERDDGAFVWRNWDKWVQRVENVVSWLDGEIVRQRDSETAADAGSWQTRGFVCGTEWYKFKETVQKYRQWLEGRYAPGKLREKYVFAHNDTQYGNILRKEPPGSSPLLLPANSHKQLVVIDFEYASANTPGLEFANHFTEWCYDYTGDGGPSWRCNTGLYPNPEEQDRFVRAYVRHRPDINITTPQMKPVDSDKPKRPAGPTSSLSNFTLDARIPPESAAARSQAEIEYQAQEDKRVRALLEETHIWRLANSAQWVAWGIVQAKVLGMPDFGSESIENPPISESPEHMTPSELQSDPLSAESQAIKEDIDAKRPDPLEEDDKQAEEEFDYLRYARDRAMFFWGDALSLGIVKAEELPEDVRENVKIVDF